MLSHPSCRFARDGAQARAKLNVTYDSFAPTEPHWVNIFIGDENKFLYDNFFTSIK
jgi:hypothetical protein